MSLFKEAREIARACTDKDKRVMLRERCDEAKEAFDRFAITAAVPDMEVLVARWSRLLLAIELVGPMPSGDDTSAGRLRLPSTGHFDHDPDIHEVLRNVA